MFEIILFFIFLGSIYFIGNHIEKKHYVDLIERERRYINIPIITSKVEEGEDMGEAELVMGSVVISGDYFKMVLAFLLNIFGGRIVSYETLIDRARREAVLRMKEKAMAWGADAVMNMRFEMSKLDSMTRQNNSTGMFEILAYGTAVKMKR